MAYQIECRPADESSAGLIIGILFTIALAWLFVASVLHKGPTPEEQYRKDVGHMQSVVRNELCKINIAINGTAYKC